MDAQGFPISPEALLANRNEAAPLGPSDGKVACVIDKWVITSPNSNTIPLPYWADSDVRLRADFRYGADDYTLWPQAYLPDYCHLAAIPSKPSDSSDPLAIMWWDPCPVDFTSQEGGLYKSFGTLRPEKYQQIEHLCRTLVSRVREYLKACSTPNYTLCCLLKTLEHSYLRLGWCTSTYAEMRFAVAEVQRYYLEVLGFLDYLQIYKPRMDGISPKAESPASCVGAFTTTPRVVEDFLDAGLPVYFMRPFAAIVASPPNILEIVQLLDPKSNLQLSDASPPFPVIFRGRTNVPAKHAAMHRYTRTWMTYQDPYDKDASPSTVDPYLVTEHLANSSHVRLMADLLEEQLPPNDLSQAQSSSHAVAPNSAPDQLASTEMTVSLPAPSQHGKSSGPSKGAKQKPHDPFTDFVSPLIPPSKSYWRSALAQVRRRKGVSGHRSNFKCYAAPDPTSILTPEEEKKKTAYIIAWIRVRPAVLHQIRQEKQLRWKKQDWRELLEMIGRNSGSRQDSRAAATRDMLSKIFASVLDNIGPSRSSPEMDATSVVWRGYRLSRDTLPPTWLFHEVLWELNEANFRIELLALDQAASTTSISSSERLSRVVQCFPDNALVPLNIPTFNDGLVHKEWKARIPFVLALVDLLRQWKNVPPILRNLSRAELRGDFVDNFRFFDVEDAAARFYCQSFWDYFGRAPILPRCVN